MTKDEFKIEFKRLCDGFNYQPRHGQIEAFYERVAHGHPDDWREAVTDLLCAPQFPRNLDLILSAVDVRAEQRRRHGAHQENYQAKRTLANIGQCVSMQEALEERPDLLGTIQRIRRLLCLALLIWWLAIISPSGETQVLEYRTKEACSLIERLYQAAGTKTTICQWKPEGAA